MLTLDTRDVPMLRTYAGTTIKPSGRVQVNVSHHNQLHSLQAIVVPGSGSNLLGRDWLAMLKVNWATANQVNREDFLKPYEPVYIEAGGHCIVLR